MYQFSSCKEREIANNQHLIFNTLTIIITRLTVIRKNDKEILSTEYMLTGVNINLCLWPFPIFRAVKRKKKINENLPLGI